MTTSTQHRATVNVGGKNIDLVPLVGKLDDLNTAERVNWVSAVGRTDVEVGEIAYTHGFGNSRRGIVSKVGRLVTVLFTTPSTVETAARAGVGVGVYGSPHHRAHILVHRPAGGAL